MTISKNEMGLYEATVDGRKYQFEKWGAEDSMDTLMDIAAVTGKPVGDAFATLFGAGNKGLDTEVKGDAIATIIGQLTNCLYERKALCKLIIKRLVSNDKMLCDGAKINFDKHYADDLTRIWHVAYCCLEVQYGNFFDVARGLGAQAQAKAKQAAASMSAT